MAYRNTWKARLAQHTKRWPVPTQELQAQAFAVLQLAYEGVAVDDDEQRRKNILCYCQALIAFVRVREATELATKVQDLTVRLQASGNGHVAR
jgi:hypothetical protein